ncbi:MAG: WD40 repeat domain-containing protein [Cyanobacteria bacterium J06597_1]
MNRTVRWLFVAGSILATGVGAIAIRVQTWPCGHWDDNSGCVTNVRLDTQDLGFEPKTLNASYRSFDLSAGGDIVLVGLDGYRRDPSGDERNYYGVLALFDTRNGELIRVLREIKGFDGGISHVSPIRELALSPDGQLAASYAIDPNENGLIVQRTSDGAIVNRVLEGEVPPNEIHSCTGALDFSTDNQFLECGSSLFGLSDGTATSIVGSDGRYRYPRLSDFSVLFSGTAPDGTNVGRGEVRRANGDSIPLQSSLYLYDSAYRTFMFAPNSEWFLDAQVAYEDARGVRFFVPPPFRRLSAIQVWNVDTDLQRTLFTNKRFSRLAWSRDSQHFAVLNEDFTVQVFQAPDSPAE